MATATEVRTLTNAYRQQQVTRAAAVAALVAAYYRSKVDVEDPAAVERWLEIMLPRLMREHDSTARRAAVFAQTLRRLEVPGAAPFTYQPTDGANLEQVRKSLLVVGPGSYLDKARQIDREDVNDQQRKALLVEAKQVSAGRVAAAAVRHVQNGGRKTLVEGALADPAALGHVRVTKAGACFFCVMLASRGLVFAEDSFADSDPRFTGDGEVKVHDSCACTMKPVYSRADDPFLKDSEKFQDFWERWGAGSPGGPAALLRFRRGYNYWLKTGEFLSWEQVAS